MKESMPTRENQMDLQSVLLNYYRQKVSTRASELWDKLNLNITVDKKKGQNNTFCPFFLTIRTINFIFLAYIKKK